jgi:hemoglobin-like flavoprotein
MTTMNTDQIRLVQESFEHVRPIAATAADLFYGRLFQQEPGLRPMFSHDLTDQKAKLMATLGFVVAGLAQPEKILGAVRQLGQRHASYGARPEHYRAVGVALLWTLERGLGEKFTPCVAEAWAAAFSLLSSTMQAAAAQALEPA